MQSQLPAEGDMNQSRLEELARRLIAFIAAI